MKKYFCNKKFRSLLLTGSITTVIQYLLILSDTIVVGNILGEQELAAINVVKPIHSVAIFLASLISIGTSVFYSLEIGKFNRDRANALYSQGIILSALSGITLSLIGLIGKNTYFSYLILSDEVAGQASDYYFFYQFVILLLPLYTVLLELVYSDGDGLICNISSALQIVVNIASSVFLCFTMGMVGVGLGTLLGLVTSIIVLLLHFFRKQNTLKFLWHFSLKDLKKILKCGITDSAAYLFIGLTSLTATKFVIYMFGEGYLPVLVVVFNIIELTIVFDGIGQAITPIVNVYRGESNSVGIKRVMKTALFYAVGEGLLLSLIMFCFGGTIAELFGLSDPALIEQGRIAVALISPFFFCSGVLFLLTTYYMIIEKVFLATAITAIKDLIIPCAFIYLFGTVSGINGVWTGLGLSPFASVLAVMLAVYLRYGGEKFPLLLEKEKKDIHIFDIELSKENIIALRDRVADYLAEKEISRSCINKIMLLIEETGMMILENNSGKRVSMECSVMISEDIQIIIRDDGVVTDITDCDSRINSLRSYVAARVMAKLSDKQNLVTTGYNRSVFRFEK